MHSPTPLPRPYPKRVSEGEDVIRSVTRMGTHVTVHVVGDAAGAGRAHSTHSAYSKEDREQGIERALAWFCRVEECCTRFDPRSELMQLAARPGVPVRASTLLFEAVQFALAVAEESSGAFDPTVGRAMEARGFNRHYGSGETIDSAVDSGAVSYRDVRLDAESRTITLLRPLILDLGAVAKGLAVDLAARELAPFENFAINAGGDLYLGGRNPEGEPWSIGIRHPRGKDGSKNESENGSAVELIDSVRVSNRAVCTSGDYERRAASGEGHHILDPRTGASPDRAANGVASVTVIAPNAVLADAVATAAFVLGAPEGIRLCERLGVDGLVVGEMRSGPLERFETRGMRDYR